MLGLNFDISPRVLTVILLITFDFQHFLSQVLRHNPHIIELIPLEFLVRQDAIKKKNAFDLYREIKTEMLW